MSEAPRRKGLPVGLIIKGFFALLISVGAFWLAFRGVEADEIAELLGNSDLRVLALFLVILLANHVLRTWRWGLLVRPLGPASWRAIFAASCIGFPATFFLPLRLGEFVRPVMIARSGVPFAGAMASVVVERVADGLFNIGLFFLLLALLPASAAVPDDLSFYASLALALFGGALIALVIIAMVRRPAFALIDRLLRPVAPGLSARILGLLGAFIDGLGALKSGGRVVLFFVLTAVFWLINGLATWLVAVSYIPDLPVIAGPFATSVVVFAIMIPAGPAFAGTLQLGFKFGLAPFGVGAGAAAAFALAYHAVQLVMMAILAGLGFLAAEPGQTKKVGAVPEGAPGPGSTSMPPRPPISRDAAAPGPDGGHAASVTPATASAAEAGPATNPPDLS